jgi:hypothetical protein
LEGFEIPTKKKNYFVCYILHPLYYFHLCPRARLYLCIFVCMHYVLKVQLLIFHDFLERRRKCYGFFDFRCHIQYICMSWIVMFGLLLAIFPTGKPSSSLLFFCFVFQFFNQRSKCSIEKANYTL